jgi:plastocyanin
MGKITRISNKAALSSAGAFGVALIIILAIAAVGYIDTLPSGSTSSFSSEIQTLQNEVSQLSHNDTLLSSKLSSLPEVNQAPQTRNIRIEWSNTENAGQDRFFESTIVVDQGDNVSITFIANDTDAHTFTLESPYDFQINGTVPGTLDYLKSETPFTTTATNNSPGVRVGGTPGNVTGTGSFIAKYAGIFEYFCIYHVALGMFGYLIVLPNGAYTGRAQTVQNTTFSSTAIQPVRVDMKGAAGNPSSPGFNPPIATVVLGINNTVVWTNDDSFPHTVTADSGSFSSGNLNPGDSYSFTFTAQGTYLYHCSYHSWMKGTVIVKS